MILNCACASVPKTVTITDRDSGFTMEFVLIPATGEKGFMMGATESERKLILAELRANNEPASLKAELPRHKVVLTKPFYLGKFEVTQKQYTALMGTNPSHFRKGGMHADSVKGMNTDAFPVEGVSWEDTKTFMKKLASLPGSKKEGFTFRLPTEAEWEYACRGGVNVIEPFSFEKPSTSLSSTQANFNWWSPFGGGTVKGRALGRTCKVASFEANSFGLYDMHGNVWEWCEDAYDDKAYDAKGRRDPLVDMGKNRVCRSGSWFGDGRVCRSAGRSYGKPDLREDTVGFRVALIPAR